ncbi:transcription elongation factor TFIIS [Diaporthe eres]|uniref:Transcription elongation factor TFIIS n=1 Tax=Diaporthe eres TaxID=83184 RepID=A0ABR1PJZ0_DIAER
MSESQVDERELDEKEIGERELAERELADKLTSFAKAVTGGEPDSTILAMLKGFETSDPPSEDSLRKTGAGRHAGKLRSSNNKEIAGVAMRVVEKWRKSVGNKGGARNDARHKMKMASSRTSTPSNTASPGPPPTPSANQPYQGDTEKRHFKTDKVDLKRTSSDIRNNSVGVLYNGLAYRSTDSVEVVVAKAAEVEAAAFKHFKGEGTEYKSKIKSLFSNLKVKSNRELGRRVMSGEIAPAEFVKMSQDELKSQEHKERDSKLEKENMNKAQVAQPEKSISDALTCGKCGQKKVSYSQAQTRSADEPMTTFCECLVCGNRWKFS